jgi:hypothetical protein
MKVDFVACKTFRKREQQRCFDVLKVLKLLNWASKKNQVDFVLQEEDEDELFCSRKYIG